MKVEATVVRRQSDPKSEVGILSENLPSRPRLGLVLSSGGAKGLAHIGVIQVLEEHGIQVDAVIGSSMGAYVAAVWAFGHDSAVMEKLAREMETPWSWLRLMDPSLMPRCGLLRGEKMLQRLKASIGNAQFTDLARPLRVVATNLSTLERMVFSSGEVARAVQASSAIPGVCAPIRIGGELFFDGGVVDPLPVEAAREMGVDVVLAVNVVATSAHLRSRSDFNREQSNRRQSGWNRAGKLLRRTLDTVGSRNLFDVLYRTMLGAQIRLAEHSARHADLVLRPLSPDGRWHEFHRPGKYIALGRRTAEEHLAEIKSLTQGNNHHEHGTPRHTLAVAA
jgi:NTE family protein